MPRPNILLLCTDQQRYDALGAYGNTELPAFACQSDDQPVRSRSRPVGQR